MKPVLIAPPDVTKKQSDPASGFTLFEQPVTLSVTAPRFEDGTPFASLDPKSGTYLIDAAAAKETYTFGALLFRQNLDGSVEVFDGDKTWWPEPLLDATFAAGAKPAEYAFDPKANAWSATFVIVSAPGSDQPEFPTDPVTHRPAYGFLSFFRTPKSAPVAWFRSARGAAFSIVSAADAGRVHPGLLKGLARSKDPKTADGFAVFVDDGSGVPTAELIVSGDSGQPARVVLRYLQAGVPRASVALEPDGTVHLTAATRVLLDAPVVELTGELHAQTIRYRAFADGTEQVL